MKKEVIKFDKEERSRGDIELDKGDRAKAYYYYVRDGHIAGLRRLAKRLKEDGKKKDAAAVLAKAHQLCNVEKEIHKEK